jgi:hypothetical protein
MSLPRLMLAWILVSAWFLAWEEVRRRLGTSPNGERTLNRTTVLASLVEALLLTLFAALWFGSLGHGGWLLLFTVVGLLIELPRRLRDRGSARASWLQAAADTARIAAAGGLLAWRIG